MMKFQDIFDRLRKDPRYVEGITYGKPRKGHDEGTVDRHITELCANLLKIQPMLTEEEYWKLLIVIHVHDTFKLAGKRMTGGKQVSLRDPRCHPLQARAFLAEFTDDPALLAIVQWHDEGHALWKQTQTSGAFSKPRLLEMLQQVTPDVELFLLFTVIDGYTVSKLKDRSPKWFLDTVTAFSHPLKPFRAYEALKLLEA
jgi:hypothetical protein